MGLALSLVPSSLLAPSVRAQDNGPLATYSMFLPLMLTQPPKVLEETFVTDPGWAFAYLKNDPKDGSFEQSPAQQTYLAHVTDNSAMMASWPTWELSGDYMLEVDARHVSPLNKSFNGLGLVFNLEVSDTDPRNHDFYVLMLANGAAQHFWTVAHFHDTEATYLTNGGYRGGTNFMHSYDHWNQLEVRVVDGAIYTLINKHWLPNGTVEANEVHLVEGRLAGLVVTSYEFDEGEMEFDNFRLTQLFPGDPEYEEVIAHREQMSAETIEFDTPALDLH